MRGKIQLANMKKHIKLVNKNLHTNIPDRRWYYGITKNTKETLTMKEAAEYLGISYWLINQLVRRKQIPCSKVGGKFLFRVQALDEYLNRKEKESVSY